MVPLTTRRRGRKPSAILAIAALGLAGLMPVAARAQAADWPARPVTLVTPLAAGSASDVALRIVAEKMGGALGQSLLVDNVTGASGAIGAERVARAPADGYTLCGCNNAILGVLPNLRKVPYDPAKSFKPVGMVAVLPTVLVAHPDFPAKSIEELVAYARARPGQVSYASGGVGSPQHIAMAMLEAATGIKLMHVPYKGASPAAVGVAAGEVQVMFNAVGTVLPLVKSGKLRPVAMAGAQRSATLPGVATVAESGVPGYDYASWIGIVAPAGTPDAVVARLSDELARTLAAPDIARRLADNGIEPFYMDAPRMADYMARDHQRMAKVVRDAGMDKE